MAVRTPNPSMNASVNPTVLAPGGIRATRELLGICRRD